MTTIALIGPDGAGKTTLTGMLRDAGVLPIKYVYMGINMSASNVALPTARLAASMKHRLAARATVESTRPPRRRWYRPVWVAARLANRLADAWFRQLVSWTYQWRGYVVLYDRHFTIDFAREVAPDGEESLDRLVYRWCVTRLYPRPDVVIFLDAPGTVLFARKGELTIEELERRRQAMLRQGAHLPGFHRVDATRPLPEVFEEIKAHVLRVPGIRRHAAREVREAQSR